MRIKNNFFSTDKFYTNKCKVFLSDRAKSRFMPYVLRVYGQLSMSFLLNSNTCITINVPQRVKLVLLLNCFTLRSEP